MTFTADRPSGRSQDFTFSRRKLFQRVVATTLPLAVLPKPCAVPPLKNRPLPEFWFGELVSFYWNDEDSDTLQPYSETGEVIGVIWNPREGYWEYTVTWLSSTAYPQSEYPLYDGNFLTGEELCKL
ncbi:hypothetical protein [Microcoleus sp. herbarium2]|uniref:hypothetical protein n=1 Tax=Microcoleus sp. herbarium2 TaxID=3055433 RepID=UPI002FD7489A